MQSTNIHSEPTTANDSSNATPQLPQFSCRNCGESDLCKFQFNRDDDSHTCTSCGLVHGDLGYMDMARLLDRTILAAADNDPKNIQKKYKATYKRRVHFMEVSEFYFVSSFLLH